MMTTEAGRVLVKVVVRGQTAEQWSRPEQGEQARREQRAADSFRGRAILFRAEVTLIDERRFDRIERAGALLPRQVVGKRGVGLPATLHIDRAKDCQPAGIREGKRSEQG